MYFLTFLSFDKNDLGLIHSQAEWYPPLSIFHSIFSSRHLLTTYCVPDTVLGSGNIVVSKNAHGPWHHGGSRLLGEPENKWKIATVKIVEKEMYRWKHVQLWKHVQMSYGWRLNGDFRNQKLTSKIKYRDDAETWFEMSSDMSWACF